ncbi:MAG: hypothetical protein E7221_04150 [Clostridiales bacterium]|nr:hypothetical protein [Clostridiales bacterium]
MDNEKLRKYEHTLAISGAAVVAFGIWSVVKAVVYFIVIPLAKVGADLRETGGVDFESIQSFEITDRGLGYITAISIVLVLMIDLLMRFYVGRAAIIEGRGRKKSIFYLILASVMIVFLGISIVRRAIVWFIPDETGIMKDLMDTAGVSQILDLTSLFALIQVIVSAIMVRRLREQLEVS